MIYDPNLSDYVKLHLKGNPLIFPLYMLFTQMNKKHITLKTRLCLPWYDIVLDGYQRSGNSFAYNLVTYFYPSLKVVHHTHSVATLKTSFLFKIPIVILLRNPVDAICSSLVRSRKNPRFLINNYIWFYSYVQKKIDKIKLVSFETVTGAPHLLLKVIAQSVGMRERIIDKNEISAVEQVIFRKLVAIEKSKGKSDYQKTVAIPSQIKEEEKKKIKSKVIRNKHISDAIDIYNKLRRYAI